MSASGQTARYAKSSATVKLNKSYEKAVAVGGGSTSTTFDWSNLSYRKLEKSEPYREEVIAELHRVVVHQRNQRKAKILREVLVDSRDAVLDRARKIKSSRMNSQKHPHYFPRLTSNDEPQRPLLTDLICCQECSTSLASPPSSGPISNDLAAALTSSITPQQQSNDGSAADTRPVTVRLRPQRNNKTVLVSLSKPILLEGTHDPNPKSNATIFLKAHYATEDEKNLTYVPYFGDDDREDVVSELYNLEGREKVMEYGAEYLERETNDIVDETLQLLQERIDTSRTSKETISELHDELANEMDVNIERIHERYNKVILGISSSGRARSNSSSSNNNNNSNNNHDSPPSISGGPPSCPLVEKQQQQQQHPDSSSALSSLLQSPKKNSSTLTRLSYKDVMDSYRSIFCRRCFSYDCNSHGNISKPSLELQGELSIAKEREGHWQDVNEHLNTLAANKDDQETKDTKKEGNDNDDDDHETKKPSPGSKMASMLLRKRPFSTMSPGSPSRSPRVKKKKSSRGRSRKMKALTPLQESVCERAFLMFQGDIDKIAQTIHAPRDLVANYVEKEHLTLKAFHHVKVDSADMKKKKKENVRTSMKNYNVAWLKRVEDAEIHPLFIPCDHEGPCSEENCSCVKNAFFCTKHCVWGEKSRNFFRGCACKGGKCGTKSCACFAAKRECDPDLCRTCGACTDPPNQPARNQRCRNDNIGMRRHCHLLLAKSTIENAGWGIYTKNALKKGDFVHEYVGEVISQEEAERRGRIYDKVNRSYLFNLSSDYVVDASRKGNKTRFANHSSKPNCYTKMVNVNGDIRIGLFAKEDIAPQSELFFDYRYDVGLDNDLIVKPGKTVAWMKDPKMANKISKKKPSVENAPGEARMETNKG